MVSAKSDQPVTATRGQPAAASGAAVTHGHVTGKTTPRRMGAKDRADL
jgi:hypothetical protein